MKTLRIGCAAVILLIPAFTAGGARPQENAEGHRSGLAARVTVNGASRTVQLQGVGCSQSMCSRVFISSTSENEAPLRTWFDSIASIRETTETDALFQMKDGTQRRVALVPDFRVLYVSNRNGIAEKLDLATIQSLEFVDSGN